MRAAIQMYHRSRHCLEAHEAVSRSLLAKFLSVGAGDAGRDGDGHGSDVHTAPAIFPSAATAGVSCNCLDGSNCAGLTTDSGEDLSARTISDVKSGTPVEGRAAD